MKRIKLGIAAGLLVVTAGVGTADADTTPASPEEVPRQAAGTEQTYLILARGNSLPSGLADSVASAGGSIAEELPQIGVATATSTNPDFATSLASVRGIRSVSRSPRIQRVAPTHEVAGPNVSAYGNPPQSSDDDRFFDLQWGHDAVDAPEAWSEGRRGAQARVAVLDTGFDLDHPDLAPNIVESRSFVPGEGAQWVGGIFSHGTHTAGTIAAADNGLGIIGVAPEASLLLGKVLPDAGCGGDGPILAGIVWAGGEADADVISLSLGAPMNKSGYLEVGCDPGPEDDIEVSASEVAEIRHAYDRAVRYARSNGATVIASAGNDASDGDHTADLIHLPSDAVGVISISATAPTGWAADPTTNLDSPASYTNFGRSVIDFSAPGGDLQYPGEEDCTVAGITRACFVFDLVFSTGSDGWYWSAGTSMAAPHAAGIAALIVGANGGERAPVRVEAAMRELADPLGGGNDPYYGKGAVDATNSVEDD
ncbi:MAG: S8 family peptidase [Desertimonas sp.]